jgi:FlaA1/EpsC-like NDP-sugar epimerase
MLEMGEPVSILDLAQRMIRLSGLHPGTDIPIRIIGPRVGEKIHEQLHSPSEQLVATTHPSILRLERTLPNRDEQDRLQAGLEELAAAATDRNEVRSRRVLFDLVNGEDPEYELDDSRLEIGDIGVLRVGGRLALTMEIEDDVPA